MMLNREWSRLKSGTDIRGNAVEYKGVKPDLTDEVVEKTAGAFVLWLEKRVGKKAHELKISIGRDSRITGEHILGICAEVMKKSGAELIDCGLSSTPAMFMTTLDLGCDGAVQITASHHPFYRNGLKFFTKDGGLEGEDIETLLALAQDGKTPESTPGGSIKKYNYMKDYAEGLRNIIKKEVNSENYDKPLSGFKIVVDAGNGAGGFYASEVLEPLGADAGGSVYLEPDGMFPNHIPNPENEEAMASICSAVKRAKADLGVIFDTDVDRGGAVDSSGNEINRNRLVAIAAAIALEDNPGGLIVTDSVTSSGLKKFIEEELGGKHLRFKRGYKNVINEAIRQNKLGVNCPLAIETSGHAAMRDNYFLDDGAYLCTKIIIKLAKLRKEGKSLEALTERLEEPLESVEIRMNILTEDFKEYGQGVIDALTEYAEKQAGFIIAPDNHEGIRISFDKENGDGWLLLRLSVHDPIMPMNIESGSIGGVKTILKKLESFFGGFGNLDSSGISDILERG